ncbi:unnamed protein product [Eruca vesicaria subsp. sativa]|uniref:Uncharacterized protein n=1 Tax=Eruca vesicaria subsp. sativa TaxID=29727 RepID=A0ABC8KP05_ERUVS|nr:unnamed protein product [Eruca vesicaria subsp. sativa]
MKDRGKRTATERRNDDVSLYYSTPSEFSCRKHPSVSPVGICPYCLNDRLVNLVCSQCGEQKRLSSCSCSDISPNHADVDTGNVRISSLIEEETTKQRKPTTKQSKKTEESVVVFKRSSSSCVEISKTKHHRFSRIGRFLKKINPRKERPFDPNNNDDDDDDKDSWRFDGKTLRVSRSRSLCSFRGGNNGYLNGSEEDVSSFSGARSSFSAATEHRRSNFEGRKSNFSETTETRRSNFSESEPPRRSCFEARKSNFSETEYPRRSNFSETEYKQSIINSHPRRSNYEAAPRKSNVNEEQQHRKSDSSAMSFTRRVLSMKESYFTGGEEESGFIDLKFDSSGGVGGGEVVVNDGVLEHGGGGSCRLTKKDREVSKSRRSFKGWKWIFGHHYHLHHHQRDS